MTTIRFIEADGTERPVEVADGTTLMQAGVAHGIAGIIGECGGSCMCATCHVLVGEEASVPGPSPEEEEMLDFALAERLPGSRLGCQIAVTPALDGAVIRVPG